MQTLASKMGPKILMYATLLVTVTSPTLSQTTGSYRLPNTVIPSEYDINLEVTDANLNGTNMTFLGSSSVIFQVTEQSSTLSIHSGVNITTYSITENEVALEIKNVTYNSTTEITTLTLNDSITLQSNVNYKLATTYTGTVDGDGMHGLYASEYTDENNNKQYLLTTQLEQTYARRVFPCFDEPHFKATFSISIRYPAGYTVLGNTNVVNVTQTNGTGQELARLAKSPKMSTYLVAFTISKFTCTSSAAGIAGGISSRVCSRNQTAADRHLALNYTTKLVTVLENITGISYSMMGVGKMDQFAIPDFEEGAMENWGHVSYRESRLLWNADESSDLYFKKVVTVVAHELTHMWFGNWVTLDWWDYTFLNEGFATLFEYFSTAKVDECSSWEMDKRFIVETQQVAFEVDAKESSPSLSKKSDTANQIKSKFGTISYNKGASILRMVENFMGEDNFITGLKAYLATHQLSNVKPSDLWESLQSYSSASLPSNKSLNDVMTNWVDKPGFPVVTVSSAGNNSFIITQAQFMYSGSNVTQWYVPISYTVSNESLNFQNKTSTLWLEPGKNLTLADMNGVDWIILNNKASAYYRVNYDYNLWMKIKETLQSNHSHIDVLSRSQIVNDLLNLARAKLINYTIAFEILDYLGNETDYYPWYSALMGFEYLLKVFGGTDVGARLNEHLTKLNQKIHNTVVVLDNGNQADLMKNITVLNIVHKLMLNHSVDTYLMRFKQWKENGTSVNKNLRSIVYCHGLRYSNDSQADWNLLWNKLRTTNVASEEEIILTALGCTTNKTLLHNYLNLTIDASSGIRRQDIITAWRGVISSSLEGLEAALEFISDNHASLKSYNVDTDSLIGYLGGRLTTEEQINKLSQIIDKQEVDEAITRSVRSAVKSANATLKWRSDVRGDFEKYFNITSPPSNSNTTSWLNTTSTPVLANATLVPLNTTATLPNNSTVIPMNNTVLNNSTVSSLHTNTTLVSITLETTTASAPTLPSPTCSMIIVVTILTIFMKI